MYRIYRIKLDGIIQYVDDFNEPSSLTEYIQENYLYDSARGEQYFVIDTINSKVIWNLRVEMTKSLERVDVDNR